MLNKEMIKSIVTAIIVFAVTSAEAALFGYVKGLDEKVNSNVYTSKMHQDSIDNLNKEVKELREKHEALNNAFVSKDELKLTMEVINVNLNSLQKNYEKMDTKLEKIMEKM